MDEDEINQAIKASKPVNNNNNNNGFGKQLNNNKLEENILIDDMVAEMEQENKDNQFANELNSRPSNYKITPGNVDDDEDIDNINIDDDNIDDATYIASFISKDDVDQMIQRSKSIKNNQFNNQ